MSIIKSEEIPGRKNLFLKLKTFFKALLNLTAFKTPGAFSEYVGMLKVAIPETDGTKINKTEDERRKLLFWGNKDERALIANAFGPASSQDKEGYLEALEKFDLTDDFVASMAKHNNLVSDDIEIIERGKDYSLFAEFEVR